MNLSIIVPVHNEVENIEYLIEKIEENIFVEHELIIVNDHSTDDTAGVVKRLAEKYLKVRLIENYSAAGFANAIKTGFKNAKGEYIVPVMGDLCDDLGTIALMLQKMREGYDVVCASRYMQGGQRLGGSKIKAFFSASAGKTLDFILGIPTHDIANAYKMYRKKVIDEINLESQGFAISMELPLKAYFKGFKITEVPTVWKERTKGKSNFKVFKLLPSYLKLYFWAIMMRLKRKWPNFR